MNILNIKANLIIVFGLLLVFNISAQADTEGNNYDLPPGAVIKPKADLNRDLSGKINELRFKSISSDDLEINAEFIKADLTNEDWERLKVTNPDEFDYYQRALEYYEALSPKVKTILNTDELWHLYMFDLKTREEIKQY